MDNGIVDSDSEYKLLALVEEKLEEQQEAQRMTEERVTEWIKTRARKMELEDQK